MGLDDYPERGKSTIYDEDGSTAVPKDVREERSLKWKEGQKLVWIKEPDEEYVRVYSLETVEETQEQE